MYITIDATLLEKLPGFSLGMIHYSGMSLSSSPKMLMGRMNYFIESLRIEHSLETMKNIPNLSYWRAGFKALGIDPSRYRPSSEALLRRILQGNPFHWVNSAVDINNFLSIMHFLPFGLYDVHKLQLPIRCQLGTENDVYSALNGRDVTMNGKIILADGNGAFGSLIVDSLRTSVSTDSTELLQIIFIPPNVSPNEQEKIIGSSARMMIEINGGEVVESAIVSTK
ncbi:B3/4 domain-containing protein [Brevibacillus laterosporus]|uniref:B3/B4 domain-containing protein n=1 Tax=Brevibacillus laterosporus TaxID=1465 RepID=UPI000CE53B8E|nr:phenylalanine--tRNA ligase beta subunit-related protein [Brevibacillus laterosporus]MBG9772978.1 hypothetical protein [Brevibacillus laterosporus]PPA82482.1 hypothetical protein C4A75_18350 [Brevibacillus laterosporus]